MKGFFPRWLKRSLAATLVSGAVSVASLAVVSTLVFCLVSVSSGVKSQLGTELKAYGANMLILPRTSPLRFGLGSFQLGGVSREGTVREEDLKILSADFLDTVEDFAPGLAAGVHIRGAAAGAAGYQFERLRKLNPLWRVSPRWPRGGGEGMIGSSLAKRLGVRAGDEVEVSIGEKSERVVIVAEVETGGGEDDNLFLPLGMLQGLAGREGFVSHVLARADFAHRPPDETARAIEAAIPTVEARTLRQVAGAEENLLKKVTRLLWISTLAVGAATAFTVVGTIGVLLLSRRREIGLCLALGAEPGRLWRLFMSEAAVSGLAGGVAGCALGAVASRAVALSVFGAPAGTGLAAAPAAIALSLCISLAASAWPVRRALRVSPCEALREQ